MADLISTAEQPTGTSADAILLEQMQALQQQKLLPVAALQKTPNGSQATDRFTNWLVGVNPQDVRFPINIAQLAFTATYFGALTADRRKIYVNRRDPGWHGNCKRRCIDFSAENRPSSIVSFDHRDTICVVFRRRIEFYCLATVTRVGIYETATAEVAAAGARGGRAPLGALWCSPVAVAHRQSRYPQAPASAGATTAEAAAAFTVWTDRTDAPQRALLLGPSAVGRSERFLCFYWTSADTVLLVSRQEDAGGDTACASQQPPNHRFQAPHPASQTQQLQMQPLVFCAYDTAGRRPMQRLCRRSVYSARQFCLSPDGRLLLLSGGSRHQLLEAATLRQLLVLPRRQASIVAAPMPMAVTNCGDLMLLQMPEPPACGGAALEIHRRGGGLGSPGRYELAALLGCGGSYSGGGDCRIYAVGELGALIVFEQEAFTARAREADGDQPNRQQQQQQQQKPQQQMLRSLVALVDLNGNVIMRAEWPRSHVHLVSDDLLVHLKRLSTKPFSAAHACIFDFNQPPTRRSHWASAAVSTSGAPAAATTGAAPAANVSGPATVASSAGGAAATSAASKSLTGGVARGGRLT